MPESDNIYYGITFFQCLRASQLVHNPETKDLTAQPQYIVLGTNRKRVIRYVLGNT
jgi:hypothetical protein